MGTTTLSMDCGGGGIKALVLDCEGNIASCAVHILISHPLLPEKLVETIASLTSQLPGAGRVTVGMSDMTRHGAIVTTPHYITKNGPRSRVLSDLVEAWGHFDMGVTVSRVLGIPSLILSDAEVAGAGVVMGHSLGMIVALSTGPGSAVFDNGVLAPYMEVSQGPVRWGLTYDDYIGEYERLHLDDAHWPRRMRRVVDVLYPMYLWGRLYLGGDSSRRITAAQLAKIGDDAIVIPDEADITGGIRC